MNFFHNYYKIAVLPVISAEIRTSARNMNFMEKFFIFHDQGTFSLLFIGSLLLHIVLGITIGAISEMWVPVPPPIRAKIGVRFAQLPSKPAPINRPKPVLQKLDTGFLPKLTDLVPKKPVLKKPVLKETPKKSTLPKPALNLPETPRLKMSEPKKTPSVPRERLNMIPAPQALKAPKKPLLLPADSPEISTFVPSLPKLSKDPVPPSTLTSKKSKLSPSRMELPKIPLGDITPNNIKTPKNISSPENINTPKNIKTPKNISTPEKIKTPKIIKTPKFSKVLELPVQKLPETIQPAVQEVPTIPQAQPPDKPETKLEEIFPEKITPEEPLQDLGIPEQADERKLKEILDAGYLQRKKIAQLASEEYNLHIRTRIIPKLGSYSAELYVRIRLKIVPSGKIISYEVIKKSGVAAFDQAAELAVRNAILEPLPSALGENPPYIVTIRIVPQN